MEKHKKYPYKLDFGVSLNGRILPVWVYDRVPEGMRQVRSLRELWYGRAFLYPSQLSPGEYLTGYMRRTSEAAVGWMWDNGIPMYVQDRRQ